MRKGTFEAPKRASASHLIHLIGVDQFSNELAKQQKAMAAGIIEVVTATSIRRTAPASRKEKEIMSAAQEMHQQGEIDDIVWAQIRALYVYLGAPKDSNGCIIQENLQFPEGWEPARDLNFAKKLLPKFLYYQLQNYSDLDSGVQTILLRAGTSGLQIRQQGLSLGDIRLAEEQSQWDTIKNSGQPRDFHNHIRNFKGGAFESLARKKLEELAWKDLGATPSYSALASFVKDYPHGRLADKARARMEIMGVNPGRANGLFLKAATIAIQLQTTLSQTFARLLEWLHPDRFAGHIKSRSVARFLNRLSALRHAGGKPLAFGLVAISIFLVSGFAILKKPAANLSPEEPSSLIRTFNGHTASLRAAAFIPGSSLALSASADKTLRLWDIQSGKSLRTFRGHRGEVYAVSISPDGGTALSGGHDSTMRLWEISTGRLIHTFAGHIDSVVSVSFSESGHLALSASHDRTLKLWHIASGKLLKTFRGHEDWVVSASFIKGTNGILSGSHDTTIRLWDIATGKSVRVFKGHEDWVASVSASKSNLTVLSSSYDNTVRLWNMTTGEEIRSFESTGKSVINSLAFTPDEKMVLSSSLGLDKSIYLWDLESGKKIKTFQGHQPAIANSVTISPDGAYALSAGEDNTLKLWRLKDS